MQLCKSNHRGCRKLTYNYTYFVRKSHKSKSDDQTVENETNMNLSVRFFPPKRTYESKQFFHYLRMCDLIREFNFIIF